MSFFQKKMSQNDWATILPFGPVTLALISGTEGDHPRIISAKFGIAI
jgi:hypothetical protein